MTEPLGQVPLSEIGAQSFTEEMQAGMDFVESERAENGAVTINGRDSKKVVILTTPVELQVPAGETSPARITKTYVFLTQRGVKELFFDGSNSSSLSEEKLKSAIDKIQTQGGVISDNDQGYSPPNPELKNGKEMLFLGEVDYSNQPGQPGEGLIHDITNPNMLPKAIEAGKARVQEMRRPERLAQQASLQAVRSIMPPK